MTETEQAEEYEARAIEYERIGWTRRAEMARVMAAISRRTAETPVEAS